MTSNIRRKLAMSVGAAVMTTCCLTSTTYAWFAKSANAWIDEYNLKLHTDEGIEISVDGEHFYDSVSKDMLIKAITLSRYNLCNPTKIKQYKDVDDDMVAKYSGIALQPVSPSFDTMDFYGFDAATLQADSNYYLDNGIYTPENLTEAGRVGKGDYVPTSYISFDLSFRAIASSNDAKDQYSLIFASERTIAETAKVDGMPQTYIKAEEAKVVPIRLNNILSIPTQKDTRENPTGIYESGESITINPADAMRMGITTSTETLIFEPNEGYGSYALHNIPADAKIPTARKELYEAEKNPMYTYFNNTHNLGKLYIPDYDERYINTIKNFNGEESLGTFTKNADGTYNDVKITVYLWLDGYDADYLEGVDTDSIHFFLNFTKKEVE